MRINKYVASLSRFSRRQVDELIVNGKVKVNEKVLDEDSLGLQISEADIVYLNNKVLVAKPVNFIYLVLNKPKNFITSTKRQADQRIVLDLIPDNLDVYPVGRLDKNSQGLLLFTNDGDLAQQLTHPKYEHEKEYIVQTKENIDDKQLNHLIKGVKLAEGLAKAKKIVKLNERELNIILTTGLKRQIRRMLEAVGNKVVSLERVRINKLKLENMPIGKWRYINKKQII